MLLWYIIHIVFASACLSVERLHAVVFVTVTTDVDFELRIISGDKRMQVERLFNGEFYSCLVVGCLELGASLRVRATNLGAASTFDGLDSTANIIYSGSHRASSFKLLSLLLIGLRSSPHWGVTQPF